MLEHHCELLKGHYKCYDTDLHTLFIKLKNTIIIDYCIVYEDNEHYIMTNS